MKNLVFILIFLVCVLNIQAQESTKKSRHESKAEKEARRMEEVKNLLADKSFIFEARQANSSTGQSIQLTSLYEVRISGDTVFSHLPFFGVAYTAEYGAIESPYRFIKKMRDFKFTETEKGYSIEFEVKNKSEIVEMDFKISKIGYATLFVTSVDRRPISFYGIILKPDTEKEKLIL